MRYSTLTSRVTFLCASLFVSGLAEEAVDDPFATSETPDAGAVEAKGTFWTSSQFKVNPTDGWSPVTLKKKSYPDISAPVQFNSYFSEPASVWKVTGGFFAAFDGGEFGAGLFYASDSATAWTRILDSHVQDFQQFEGDSFLASGGLAHLSMASGDSFLVTRTASGGWACKKVFSSIAGVPRIVGTSMTVSYEADADRTKLIVLELLYPEGGSPLMGVDKDGAIYYLGERAEIQKGEQTVPPKSNRAGG